MRLYISESKTFIHRRIGLFSRERKSPLYTKMEGEVSVYRQYMCMLISITMHAFIYQ